jgi:hypothetical protein
LLSAWVLKNPRSLICDYRGQALPARFIGVRMVVEELIRQRFPEVDYCNGTPRLRYDLMEAPFRIRGNAPSQIGPLRHQHHNCLDRRAASLA